MRKVTISSNLDGVQVKFRPIILAAIEKMETVLSSDAFLNALYKVVENSHGIQGELSEWKHKTVKEIHENLLNLDLNNVGHIELTLFTYYSRKNVIGYGYKTDTNIYLNTKYLQGYDIEDLDDLKNIGSNLIHEHSHDAGYEHDFKSTARRKHSLSYLINDAYEMAYEHIFGISDNMEIPTKIYYVPWYKKVFNFIGRLF